MGAVAPKERTELHVDSSYSMYSGGKMVREISIPDSLQN